MSTTTKILIMAIGAGAMLATPAMARHVHNRAAHPGTFSGAYGGAAYRAPTTQGAHTGLPYYGPYDERIVTMSNGIVLGTDPDPSIRAQMRRDGIGPNGGSGGNVGP